MQEPCTLTQGKRCLGTTLGRGLPMLMDGLNTGDPPTTDVGMVTATNQPID